MVWWLIPAVRWRGFATASFWDLRQTTVSAPPPLLVFFRIRKTHRGDLGAELFGEVTYVHQKTCCTMKKRHYQTEWALQYPPVMPVRCKVQSVPRAE